MGVPVSFKHGCCTLCRRSEAVQYVSCKGKACKCPYPGVWCGRSLCSCTVLCRQQRKEAAVVQILEKQKVSPITLNLFTLLAENGRFSKMNGVIAAFGKIMSAHRGEVVCTVTTAKPLDAKNLKELEATLKGFFKQGEAVQLTTKVDPTIIGGMIVDIGDKYI